MEVNKMKVIGSWLYLIALCIVVSSCKSTAISPPKAYGALPSERQLAWQEMEMYNMIEFSTIQYLEEKDWGWGDEDPELVNPKNFNADEIVKRAKNAGFKGFLVQAKHHGGFCMWPTKTTDYNISKSPWRDGKGDWIGEWQKACKKNDMKFGVYLSPWDRHTALFGTKDYLKMYHDQLVELLTNYGELFVVWFDGAPGEGGDGYYGGANEYRGGFEDYYNWEDIYATVRKLQPNAVIFHDPGLDIRWVGNEQGFAGETCWETYVSPGKKWDGRPFPATGSNKVRNEGERNGSHWIPAEADVSLRRRFTYHASDNHTVKTPQKLFEIYAKSVGRGACFDLNLPINRDGDQDDTDKKALEEFGKYLNKTFAENLIRGAEIEATNVRGNANKQYGTDQLLDDDRYSYWATDDDVLSPELVVNLPRTTTFNIIQLRENIKLGQRIDSVKIDISSNNEWTEIASVTSIGARRMIRMKNYVSTDKMRIRFFSPVCVAVSELSLFSEPEMDEVPIINRSKEGMVSIMTENPAYSLHYTLDGTEPTSASSVYEKPFLSSDQVIIRAASFNSKGNKGETVTKNFDASKKNWKIISQSSKDIDGVLAAIDDNENTYWYSANGQKDKADKNILPQSLIIDMGKTENVIAFSYTPRQDGKSDGTIDGYEIYTSIDNTNWTKVSAGDFPNLRNSPVYRSIPLKQMVACRYFKFIGNHVLDGNGISIAEIGVQITK